MEMRNFKCRLGFKGCPHERDYAFSDWMRANLPDSKTGMQIVDLDFVIYNYKTKKLLIIEQKLFKEKYDGKNVSFAQREFLMLVKKVFSQLKNVKDGWEFLDVHLIQFDAYDFSTGKCYLDNKEISETDLVKFLSI
jgi:hypothetical protein